VRYLYEEEDNLKFIEFQGAEDQVHKLTILSNEADKEGEPTLNVKDLNTKYVNYLQGMADSCFKTTRIRKSTKNRNSPWFNDKCRATKRAVNKASRVVNKFPSSDFLRQNYYKVKKSYKLIIKSNKDNFFNKLNSSIESGKVLNWNQFKKLNSYKSNKQSFDSQDMINFESFFSNLYADNHKTITDETKLTYLVLADNINLNLLTPNSLVLNSEIRIDEVRSCIKALKLGKASSSDKISNDILKLLDNDNVVFLTKLFNCCLDKSTYPWNDSLITPLHKKGSKEDPDNYRAVAVSSVIGKLFSTILLNRLIEFRKLNCPDSINQLGFTKGSQTYDHILTMQTIASKYKKLKKKVYAVFVDFKKAFDSVCRAALFYKLSNCGVTGKFYNILRDMYSNSVAQIKLSGFLSKKINVCKGTEQGHPLSPDLFKLFLNDLSELLNLDKKANCPSLMCTLVTHLLWADDLILLSLDPVTCQTQINKLIKYCNTWGIEINELKTKCIIFGQSETSNNDKFQPLIDNKVLEIVDSYCYLGIVLHKSGKLMEAKISLKTKAMRAFFGFKRNINKLKISFKALTMLFDSLIKPVVLYGAPLWTPTSSIVKALSSSVTNPQTVRNVIPKINRTLAEKVHLSFLKWALGVNRKASNIGTWGESGRYPLIYQSIKLTLNYYERLNKLPSGSLVHAALQEQKLLHLPWYKNIVSLLKLDEIYHIDHVSAHNVLHPNDIMINTTSSNLKQAALVKMELNNHNLATPLPSKRFRVGNILQTLSTHFKNCWMYEKTNSSKLEYYHGVKKTFGREVYLSETNNVKHRFQLTRLRISAHDLELERGRYSNIPRVDRICKFCLASKNVKITESEEHFLFDCDFYLDYRNKFMDNIKNVPNETKTGQHVRTISDIPFTPMSIKPTLMKLISPHTTDQFDESDPLTMHFKRLPSTHADFDAHNHLRSYLSNTVCAYVNRCFEKRKQFLEIASAKVITVFDINL
jgi:sorting nexin-29